jgi:hypothetical protein
MRTVAYIFLSLAAVGCYPDERMPTEPLNLAPNTLDGGRVVASGKPPLAFQYPGNGRLSVHNWSKRSLIYSLDMPSTMTGASTLIRIDVEKRAIITKTGGVETSVVPRVDIDDVYVITYVASEMPAKR